MVKRGGLRSHRAIWENLRRTVVLLRLVVLLVLLLVVLLVLLLFRPLLQVWNSGPQLDIHT